MLTGLKIPCMLCMHRCRRPACMLECAFSKIGIAYCLLCRCCIHLRSVIHIFSHDDMCTAPCLNKPAVLYTAPSLCILHHIATYNLPRAGTLLRLQFTTTFSLCLLSMERMSFTGAACALARRRSSSGCLLGWAAGSLRAGPIAAAGLSLPSTVSVRAFSRASSSSSSELLMRECNDACACMLHQLSLHSYRHTCLHLQRLAPTHTVLHQQVLQLRVSSDSPTAKPVAQGWMREVL